MRTAGVNILANSMDVENTISMKNIHSYKKNPNKTQLREELVPNHIGGKHLPVQSTHKTSKRRHYRRDSTQSEKPQLRSFNAEEQQLYPDLLRFPFAALFNITDTFRLNNKAALTAAL